MLKRELERFAMKWMSDGMLDVRRACWMSDGMLDIRHLLLKTTGQLSCSNLPARN